MLALDRLRDELRAAGARWNAGRNAMTDLAPVNRRHLGYVPRPDELSLKRREAASRMMRVQREMHADQPRGGACDLRTLRGRNWLRAVRDDRSHPCTAAAFTAAETTLRIARNDALLELAEPLLDIERPVPSGRVWLYEPFASLTLEVRASESSDRDPIVQVRGWRELHTIAAMKEWIATTGPLLTVFTVHEDFYSYTGGVYHHISGGFEGGHCVVVIGFDDSAGYWTAQNTWGTAWGEHGYFRIAFGERGIDASMWGVELS